MIVWVGQTEKWNGRLPNVVNSLMDLAEWGYELVRVELEDSFDEKEDEFVLEEVFETCNVGKEVRKLKHSLSVGDVVVLYRNKRYEVFLCQPVGWKKIGEAKVFP